MMLTIRLARQSIDLKCFNTLNVSMIWYLMHATVYYSAYPVQSIPSTQDSIHA